MIQVSLAANTHHGPATLCINIFALPNRSAGNGVPNPSKNPRKLVTNNSRATMTTTIHAAMPLPTIRNFGSPIASPGDAKKINVPRIKTLSTNGSITRPYAVTTFQRRANQPSSTSDSAAMTKMLHTHQPSAPRSISGVRPRSSSSTSVATARSNLTEVMALGKTFHHCVCMWAM